ncbi:MAG: hypothetical protein FIA92_05115 [Chloroflexi bacterium]|nr:hypothetical protein [Chloroflexota bacterium]
MSPLGSARARSERGEEQTGRRWPRIGAVRGRSQTATPSGHWVKRNTKTGRFIDVKSSPKPFKGVRREK